MDTESLTVKLNNVRMKSNLIQKTIQDLEKQDDLLLEEESSICNQIVDSYISRKQIVYPVWILMETEENAGEEPYISGVCLDQESANKHIQWCEKNHPNSVLYNKTIPTPAEEAHRSWLVESIMDSEF